jgi:type IV pilus assembly protein PilY1
MDRQLDRQVLCIGTGYNPSSGSGTLLVIDPEDGSILRTITLGSPVAGNKVTKAAAFDSDFDGYEDQLYLGDLSGKLYRVDMTGSTWTATTLFSGTQPIQATPTLTTDELDRAMICFGTGQFMTASDPGNTSQQSIFGVIDDNSGRVLTRADLQDQSLSFTALTSGKRGWFLNLPGTGERVTRNASLMAGTLYVPSFAPTNTACSSGSDSWLYSLDFRDGSAPDHANGTENNVVVGRSQSMGNGILGDPVLDLVNNKLILQSSNATLLTQNINGGLRNLLVRSWRQKWN